MLLLTDGRVFCHQLDSASWWIFTPDASGDYANGKWSDKAVQAMPTNSSIPAASGGPANAPRYFASAVLHDGRVFVAGGEDNAGTLNAESVAVQVYDPLTDVWSPIAAPTGWTAIGDAPSCVLPDGRVLLGTYNSGTTNYAILDPVTLTWTLSGASQAKNDSFAEETLTLLPDGTILSVQCSNIGFAEKYVIATGVWVQDATRMPATLPQPCPPNVAEIGPAILLPDGRVFAIGATGATALFSPPPKGSASFGSWVAGPTLTDSSGNTSYPMDAPAALLPNGRVLCAGSPAPPCNYPPPTTLFEFDPLATHPLQPGGSIATFEPEPGVLRGLTIDPTGAMNIVWADPGTNAGWQGPIAFGDARLVPGARIAVFEQSPGVWAGLTIDKFGGMNVVWGDFNTNAGWQGPIPFGDPHLVPGAPVAVFPQSSGVWAGLTVDKNGKMNVVWGDFNTNAGWKGPKAFGDAHLVPGAPVSVFEQSPNIWTGLTVDKNGKMNVVWGDFNTNAGWKGPVPFGGLSVISGPTYATSSNGSFPCFQARFLLLPSGQVLFSNFTAEVAIYTPDGAPDPRWRPVITTYSQQMTKGQDYTIGGTQLNGLSQAVSYGDDAQMATNYPLARLTSADQTTVTYLRTSHHSTMGVSTGNTVHTTNVNIPSGIAAGTYELVVVANGIASNPVTVELLDG